MVEKEIVVVGIGHSAVVSEDGSVIPAGTFQEVEFSNFPNSFPFRRTGIYQPAIEPDGPRSYLACCDIVVEAGVECLRSLDSKRRSARLRFIGGQPDYLKAVTPAGRSDVCEGEVMADYARSLLRAWHLAERVDHIGGTRTTEEDVRETLLVAADEHCELVFLIVAEFRIPGVAAYLYTIANESDELADAARKVVIRAAEVYARKPSALEEMYFTAAYRRTAENESHRVKQLLRGNNPTTGGKS